MTGSSEGDLTPVRGEVPYLNERTKGRFLQPLGSAKVYDHPYCAYLQETGERLPEAAPRARAWKMCGKACGNCWPACNRAWTRALVE